MKRSCRVVKMARLLFVLSLVILSVAAEDAEFTKCDLKEGETEQCTVSAVRITPCPGKSFCRLKKGHDVLMSFDLTPNFAATKLKSSVFWASSMGDLPWVDLDTEACKHTGCPTEAGKTQQYNYSIRLGKKTPDGRYTLKWSVFDEENPTKTCCFKTDIQIKK